MTPELTTVNTVITVLLTLLVTYLSDSIRTSVSKAGCSNCCLQATFKSCFLLNQKILRISIRKLK